MSRVLLEFKQQIIDFINILKTNLAFSRRIPFIEMQFSKCQGFLILFFFMSTIMIFVLGLVVRILASIVQAEDPEEQIGQFMNLMHDTVNHKDHLVHKMLGEQFSDQLEQLRMATLSVFAAYPIVQSLLSPDGFAAIMALIGRNSQGKFISPAYFYIPIIFSNLNCNCSNL